MRMRKYEKFRKTVLYCSKYESEIYANNDDIMLKKILRHLNIKHVPRD